MSKAKKMTDREEMLADLKDRPLRAYFKYPIGRGYDLPQWRELPQGILELLEAIWNLAQLFVFLTLRFVREIPLRPIYKAYLVIKWHRYFKKKQQKDEGHI